MKVDIHIMASITMLAAIPAKQGPDAVASNANPDNSSRIMAGPTIQEMFMV